MNVNMQRWYVGYEMLRIQGTEKGKKYNHVSANNAGHSLTQKFWQSQFNTCNNLTWILPWINHLKKKEKHLFCKDHYFGEKSVLELLHFALNEVDMYPVEICGASHYFLYGTGMHIYV